MEKSNGVFVLDLPNISNEDVFKLIEQVVVQSKNMMDGYRIETKNIIVDIIIKKS
jgi:hypothetical protein